LYPGSQCAAIVLNFLRASCFSRRSRTFSLKHYPPPRAGAAFVEVPCKMRNTGCCGAAAQNSARTDTMLRKRGSAASCNQVLIQIGAMGLATPLLSGAGLDLRPYCLLGMGRRRGGGRARGVHVDRSCHSTSGIAHWGGWGAVARGLLRQSSKASRQPPLALFVQDSVSALCFAMYVVRGLNLKALPPTHTHTHLQAADW